MGDQLDTLAGHRGDPDELRAGDDAPCAAAAARSTAASSHQVDLGHRHDVGVGQLAGHEAAHQLHVQQLVRPGGVEEHDDRAHLDA